MTDAGLFLREAEFLQRRRRALRSLSLLGVAGLGGIALPIIAKLWAPEAFDAATMLFVGGVAITGLAHVRILRRDWRCPACEVRWQNNDVLASGYWNHCAACGAELRAAPQLQERERLAATEFELQHLPHDELEARFLRRRRRGLLAFGGVVLLGAVLFGVVQAQGWGELVRSAVVALCAGLGVAVAALAARCPRCSVGLLVKGRHCQRCGFALEPDGDTGGQG
jgi:DNA-directed RNA polymerase subunit RPC12/RpoP